jgi:hypothetical protein
LIDLKNKKDIHSVIGEIDRNTILNKEEAKDNRKFPKEKIGYFLIFYMLMIFINLMKGTKEFKSIINIDR